jgi:hypothetical protein
MRWLAQLMKRIRQLGFLRVALRSGSERPEEEVRVLSLFRNRAELKKSFSGALDEVQRLKDRVKQQEGATARVQELLQELESRLAKPETAYPALVFYHLRELWALGQQLLQQFTRELEAQQIERERRLFFADFNRRQFPLRQSADAACSEATAAAAAAQARVAELQRTLAGLQRFWHYFRRRTLRAQLHAANVQALLADQALNEARQAREALEGEQATFTGLTSETRRAINLAVISYGQVLCERLAPTGLLARAQAAAVRREPPSDEYGDRASCEQLVNDIQRARLLLEQRGDLIAEIRKRTEVLRRIAQYRGSGDVLPVASSLGGNSQSVVARVLTDDIWDITRVLLA